MNKNPLNTPGIYKAVLIAGPSAAIIYGLIFALFGLATIAKGFFIFAGVLFIALIIRGFLK